MVVLLVAVAEALENLDRLRLRRGLDHDQLEAAVQGAVLLDVLAVLVQRGGADALDFAAGEGGLQHVRGVDGAFRPARAHQRVQLVDEEDRVLRAADFVHHRLDPLLELSAVLRPGDHHRQVEDDDAAVGQQFGDVALDDLLGEAFDDGGLADAGLAQEDGVVLRAAAEDLHRPLDFPLAPDDRVELALPGQLGQIAAEAVQGGGLRLACPLRFARGGRGAAESAGALGPFGAFHAVAQQVEHFLADLFELQAEVHQHLRRHSLLLAEQAEEDVLGADVVVVEVSRLFHRVLDHLLRPRRLRQLAHGDHVRAALHELLDFEADFPQVDVQVLQNVGRHPAAFFDQSQKDVFGADVFMVEPLGFLVGQLHDLPARSVNRSYMRLSVVLDFRVVLRVVFAAGRGQQFRLAADFLFPLLGVFQPGQGVELPARFVPSPRVPQQGGQHQPGLNVAAILSQQAAERSFRFHPAAL